MSEEIDKKKHTLVRTKRAIEDYDLSRSTFDRAVNDGELTRYKRGRASFLDRNEIDAWLTNHTQTT